MKIGYIFMQIAPARKTYETSRIQILLRELKKKNRSVKVQTVSVLFALTNSKSNGPKQKIILKR